MADPKEEAPQRAEFERFGEELTQSWLSSSGPSSEAKQQSAFGWLSDQTIDREREAQTYSYTRKTFFIAVAAVIIGIAGIMATIVVIWLNLGHL